MEIENNIKNNTKVENKSSDIIRKNIKDEDVVSTSKEKNGKRTFIKITAIASAVVVAGAIASHFLNKNKSATFSRNKTVIEQPISDSNVFVVATDTPKPIVTQDPVVVEKTNTQTDEQYNEILFQ